MIKGDGIGPEICDRSDEKYWIESQKFMDMNVCIHSF